MEILDVKWATSNVEKQEILQVCLMSIFGHIDYLKDQARKDRLWLYQAISNNQFDKLSGAGQLFLEDAETWIELRSPLVGQLVKIFFPK